MFEHKKQALLPFPVFLLRVLRFSAYSFSLIFVSLLIGMVGYHVFGHLGWVDSFYNASMILTGMGPIDKMECISAKIFSSFYALFSGIAFLSTIAVLFAPIVHRLMHRMHIEDNEVS
jgi:hypothetical protein